MYLSKLEINGFKSFAQRTTLVFPKLELGRSNITAIVGPNGSGKSNVADAIRWVTGEQSIKSLRGKKSEDVIFSGTDKKTRLGCAEVSLYLDDPNHQAAWPQIDGDNELSPAQYSELIITRKIYRTGESEYLINKSRARLSDILMLMAQLSFGQKSYSVIGQGMADSILSVSPQERKDFLNEAAGIKQYQLKRDHSIVKLSSTKENLNRVKSLLTEIEPRLHSLVRQVKKLEAREEMDRTLKQLQLCYYGSLWQTISQRWLEEKKRLNAAGLERAKFQEKVNQLQTEFERLAENVGQDDQWQKLQEQYYEINASRNQLLQRGSVLQSRLTLEREKNKFQKESASIFTLSLSETKNLLANLEEIKELQERLVAKIEQGNENELNAIAKNVIQKTAGLIKMIKGDHKNEAETIEANKQKKELIIKELEKELDLLNQTIKDQEEALKRAQAAIKNYNQTHQNEREHLVMTQKQLQKLQSELNQLFQRENEQKIILARTETHKEDMETEIRQELGGLDRLAHESLKKPSEHDLQNVIYPKINQLKRQLELIGGIDKEIIKEYQETKKRYDFLNDQSEDLIKASETLQKLVKKLKETIDSRFETSFEQINQEFKKYFKTIFGGGQARLIYTKEVVLPSPSETANAQEKRTTIADTPISPEKPNADDQTIQTEYLNIGLVKEGVEIEATPPGKRLKSINMLSGGERALTAIALICAIIANNPSPFVILDEVDAALDESNSVRFAEILEQLSHKTQFVVISHNRATMEKARILYGVTMSDDGISKLLSIKLEETKSNQG